MPFTLLLVLGLLTQPPTDQSPTDLGVLAAQTRQAADAPAIGVAVMRTGHEPRVAVDGHRLAGSDDDVTADDLWHWGSVTKSFTATLVARLVEKGTVDWSDTVGDWLGDGAPDMNAAYRDVTFEQLLTHRSGMPANIPPERFAAFTQEPDDPIADRLNWVRIALAQEPAGPKQVTFVYSNNGYIVAGAMLEAATGTPWEDLMQREIFDPLKITSGGFGPPGDNQPRGHTRINGADTPVPPDADNPAALGPAGRLHMSLTDMLTYLTAHATKRADFLAPATYEKLHTPAFGGMYAFGWVAISPDARWHNGSNNMWYAEAIFNLAGDKVAAVVVNDGDIESVQDDVRALLGQLMSAE